MNRNTPTLPPTDDNSGVLAIAAEKRRIASRLLAEARELEESAERSSRALLPERWDYPESCANGSPFLSDLDHCMLCRFAKNMCSRNASLERLIDEEVEREYLRNPVGCLEP